MLQSVRRSAHCVADIVYNISVGGLYLNELHLCFITAHTSNVNSLEVKLGIIRKYGTKNFIDFITLRVQFGPY
jgi:hypothetical protein